MQMSTAVIDRYIGRYLRVSALADLFFLFLFLYVFSRHDLQTVQYAAHHFWGQTPQAY